MSAYGQVGKDVARVGLTTASTGGTVALSLITAAGTAAAVPVGGWIAAGALTLASGALALVSAIKGGKIRKAEAVQLARDIGIPDPESAPGYIARALRWDKHKVKRRLLNTERQLGRFTFRSTRRLKTKRALLRAILDIQEQTGAYGDPMFGSFGAASGPVASGIYGPDKYGIYYKYNAFTDSLQLRNPKTNAWFHGEAKHKNNFYKTFRGKQRLTSIQIRALGMSNRGKTAQTFIKNVADTAAAIRSAPTPPPSTPDVLAPSPRSVPEALPQLQASTPAWLLPVGVGVGGLLILALAFRPRR